MTSKTPGKSDPTGVASIDKEYQANLIILARAATMERALTSFRALSTYWRALFWCTFMCIGAFLLGYDIQIAGGMMGVPQFRADYGFIYEYQPVLAAKWQSAFNSVSSIGSMFGGLWLGGISDRLGRRGAVGVACIVSIVGVLLQFLSPKHANGVLLIGKLINGFALGMYATSASSYCAEISPLALRSISTASVNLWLLVGIFASNGVLRGTGDWTTVYAYKLPFALQCIFPVILLIGLPFAPESPWWLVRKGRADDAERTIAHLGGPTVDAKLRRQQIEETVRLEDSYAATSTYLDCFKGENLKRTVVAMMVFVLIQSAGVVFVLGYGTYFFELAGFGTNKAFDIAIGGNAMGIFANLLTFYTADRFGRRFLFTWGMATCTVVLISIGFTWIGQTNQGIQWAVVFVMIYNFVHQASIAPASFVILAEVSSAKLRAKTVGLGIWANSLCVMLSNIIMPFLINPNEANLGGYIGFVYGVLSFAGTAWAYFFIPETKGRTVDELDQLFEKQVPARQFGSYDLYTEGSGGIDV